MSLTTMCLGCGTTEYIFVAARVHDAGGWGERSQGPGEAAVPHGDGASGDLHSFLLAHSKGIQAGVQDAGLHLGLQERAERGAQTR